MKIELKDISFSYDENTLVLDNLSLTIEEGQMVAILGHNGSGKSTLSKIIMGLLDPKSGEVIVDGVKYEGDDFDNIKKEWSEKLHSFLCLILQ